MRARRKERTRNLKRSSSVWMIMRRKLALGSVFPVCSSTSSILWTNWFIRKCHQRPGRGRHTCLRILSKTRSIKASGHGSISGALRSVTHARVRSCRSRVSRGTAWLSTSAKMSSMSIEFAVHPSLTGPLYQRSHYCTLSDLVNGSCYHFSKVVDRATFSSHAVAHYTTLRTGAS